MHTNNIIETEHSTQEVLSLTAEVVASYVANNEMPLAEVPNFIQSVFTSVMDLATGKAYLTSRSDPAVPIKKSVTDDYIVCLEDGKKMKMLKRHLKSAYNMTPEQYRERWNLSPDYPMVAPNYARRRSELAKTIGLGTSRRKKQLNPVDQAA